MIIVKPSFEIEVVDGLGVLQKIEKAGRVCYKSEKKITFDSAAKFVKSIIKSGHESVLEHEKVSVRIVCDRGVSHELVRHRIASYSQESTRYCNYNGGVVFVLPPWVELPEGVILGKEFCSADVSRVRDEEVPWYAIIDLAEKAYKDLLLNGWKPQQARSVLPNSLKTEIVCTLNLRSWRNFFELRAVGIRGKPHPQMLEIAMPMLRKMAGLIPVVFDDLVERLPNEE